MLLNRVIPLRIGYVAVVNRGQRDIDNNLTIREALRKEASFFKAHPVYRSLLKQCTTPTLTRMLNNILMHHIRYVSSRDGGTEGGRGGGMCVF